MFQYLIKEFLIMPFQKFESKFNYKIGEQLELKFSWIAKIYIDMKAVMKKAKQEKMRMHITGTSVADPNNWRNATMSERVQWVMRGYKQWAKAFKESGNINDCPDYVYFICEV